MKKIVAFKNEDWHEHKLTVFFASKKIAWSSITKWYYVAMAIAFIAGVIIGYNLPR